MGRPADSRRALGVAGEQLAAAWYEARGYDVLDRNWRCTDGELDLVLRGPGAVVFCEVKTRRTTAFGSPAEAVTRAKQRRIRGLATRWLVEHGIGAPAVRFDVAAVMVTGTGTPTIDVISDAF